MAAVITESSQEQDNLLAVNANKATDNMLHPLRRSLTMSSQESIQLWIDSISEAEYPDGTDEETELVMIKITEPSPSNVHLSVPDSDDDLVLGAEAKTLGSNPGELSLSPRISPLPPMDRDEEHTCLQIVNTSSKERVESDLDTEELVSSPSLSQVLASAGSQGTSRLPLLYHGESLDSDFTHDSVIDSVQSLKSLLNSVVVTPEEMLANLGFCGQSDSLLTRIPERFLQAKSQASGIDIDRFLDETADYDDQDSVIEDYCTKGKLLKRFSQSSIDLSSVESDPGLNVTRRRRRASSVPTILVDPSEDVDKNSPPKNTNIPWSKLSTLEEEFEPPYIPRNPWRSPRSSISFGDRRPSLQRQKSVDLPLSVSDFVRQGTSRSSSLEQDDKVFLDRLSRFSSPQTSLDKDDRRSRFDIGKKSFSTEHSLDVVDEAKKEEDTALLSIKETPTEIVATRVNVIDKPKTLLTVHNSRGTTVEDRTSSIQSAPIVIQYPLQKDASGSDKVELKLSQLKSLLKLEAPVNGKIQHKSETVEGFIHRTGTSVGSQVVYTTSDTYAGQSEKPVNVDSPEDSRRVSSPPEKPVGVNPLPESSHAVDKVLDDRDRIEAVFVSTGIEGESMQLNSNMMLTPGEDMTDIIVKTNGLVVGQETTNLIDDRHLKQVASMQDSTNASEKTEKSPLELLGMLTNSRDRLRNSIRHKRSGMRNNQRAEVFSRSLPNIAFPQENVEGTENVIINSEQSNDSSLRHKDERSIDLLEQDGGKEVALTERNVYAFQRSSAVGFASSRDAYKAVCAAHLVPMEKKDSKESDMTVTPDNVSEDRQNELQEGHSLQRVYPPAQGVHRGFSVPVVVISFDDGDDHSLQEAAIFGDSTESAEINVEAVNKGVINATTHAPKEDLEIVTKEEPRGSLQGEKGNEMSFRSYGVKNTATNAPSHASDVKSVVKSESPPSLVERTKARMLPKGYSIDSSGFEDESELGRMSPDKMEKDNVVPGGKNMCHLCQEAKLVLSSHHELSTGNDLVGSNVPDLDIKDTTTEHMKEHCKCCLQDESDDMSDLNVLCLDHDHFDYLAQQLSSLRKEVKKQEERLKEYISQQMQEMTMNIVRQVNDAMRSQLEFLRSELSAKNYENMRLKSLLRKQGQNKDPT